MYVTAPNERMIVRLISLLLRTFCWHSIRYSHDVFASPSTILIWKKQTEVKKEYVFLYSFDWTSSVWHRKCFSIDETKEFFSKFFSSSETRWIVWDKMMNNDGSRISGRKRLSSIDRHFSPIKINLHGRKKTFSKRKKIDRHVVFMSFFKPVEIWLRPTMFNWFKLKFSRWKSKIVENPKDKEEKQISHRWIRRVEKQNEKTC